MVRRSVIIAESMGGGMKQISLGAIAIAVLLSSPVMAADMPVKAPVVRAPAAAAIFNWSGFYVGGFVGGAWSGRVTASDLFSEGPVYPVGGEWSAFGDSHFKLKASVIGGVTAGVNWQAAGSSLVWGLEGEFGYMRLKGSGALPADFGYDLRFNTKAGDWYGIAAGRLGFAVDRTLIYVKGGAAFIQIKASTSDTCNTVGPCDLSLINATGSKTAVTWALGGGAEFALTNAWSVKAEYLFIDLPESVRVCGAGSGGFAGGSTWCGTHHLPSGIHTAKLGLNYRFGQAPVVARY
jgi:outer membrane immunogenic protein